jgi:alpha-tubulin suppressor-like RCC1 family protein
MFKAYTRWFSNFCLGLVLLIIFINYLLSIPVYAEAPHKFVSVSTGNNYFLALRDDGTVWTWGAIPCGEYTVNGTGKSSISWNQPIPAQVPIDNVVAISAGTGVSLILRSDGSVWAWGQNIHGALGDGTTTSTVHNNLTPVRVIGLDDVTAIYAGDSCTALTSDGSVWAWGNNDLGQLGDGTYINSPVPVKVNGISNAIAIGPGFAIKNDGTVWSWGMTWLTPDSTGHVDTSTIDEARKFCKNIPFQVPGVDHVKTMSSDGFSHTIFIKDDDSVWGWGEDFDGQLGNGNDIISAPPYLNVPVEVKNLYNVTVVSAGFMNAIALKSDGSVWAWGSNTGYSLGDNNQFSAGDYPIPVKIDGMSDITAISVSTFNSIFLKNDGSVWIVGQNGAGQKGDGSIGGKIDAPIKVLGPDTVVNPTAMATLSITPSSSVSVTPASNVSVTTVSMSPVPSQSNGLLGIAALVVCALLLIGGCVIYFGVFRKM